MDEKTKRQMRQTIINLGNALQKLDREKADLRKGSAASAIMDEMNRIQRLIDEAEAMEFSE